MLKKTAILALSVLLLTALGFSSAAASDAKTAAGDADWRFHDIVDVDFVKQYAKIPQPENVLIVDSRPYKPKYVEGHIPNAINIPDSQFDKMTDRLPADKDTLLIFYCGGLKWKLSHKSAWKAEKLGYTNVKVFAEGFPAYMKAPGSYAAVTAEYVAEQIAGNAAVVVDSRPKQAKYDKGHIPTAMSLPDSQFEKLQGKLPRDPNTVLIFYCGGFTWKLSHKSAGSAVKLGYTNVKVFAAGYPAWKKAYGAGTATAAASLKGGAQEGSIDIAQFKEIIETRPESVYLVDVRDPDEFANGSFKTAVNIPVDTLEAQVMELPADRPIIFVCSTGARSGESFYMLQDLRPELKKVYYLEAEVTFNKDGSYDIKKTE